MRFQDRVKQVPVFVVDGDAVCRRSIVVAASFVPQRLGRDNESTVLDGSVQYTTFSPRSSLPNAPSSHILKITDTGRFPHPGFKEGKPLSFIFHGEDRLLSIGTANTGDLLRCKESKHRFEKMM